MAAPPSHAQFLVSGADRKGGLLLRVRQGQPRETKRWHRLTPASYAWQLWQDEDEHLIFEALEPPQPRRQIVVDAAFTSGEVIGDFAARDASRGLFPLQDIDAVLYANWLASEGDLLLHAAAVMHGGAAYCFAGPSGAGKSTLAAAVSAASGSTVLAEDRVVLRLLGGRFWLFGTPWYFTPAACSPRGAPLAKLLFLERVDGRGVQPCSRLDGMTRLMQTAFVPYYRPEVMPRVLDNLALLAEQVQFLKLDYKLGSDVLQLVGKA